MTNVARTGPRKNKANFTRSLKFEVASVKLEKSKVRTSNFTLHTPADGISYYYDMPSFQGSRRGLCAPNKPNLAWRESEGKCLMGKELRGIEPARERGKTKPIPTGKCARPAQVEGRTGQTRVNAVLRTAADQRPGIFRRSGKTTMPACNCPAEKAGR